MKFAPLLEAMLEMENFSLLIEDVQDFANNYEALLSKSLKRMNSLQVDSLEQHRFVAACTYFARQVHAANPESPESMVDTFGLEEQINKCLPTAQAVNLAGVLTVLEYADRARALLTRDMHAFFINLFKHREVLEFFQVNEEKAVKWFNKERMESFLDYFLVLFESELNPDSRQLIKDAVSASEYKLPGFLEALILS